MTRKGTEMTQPMGLTIGAEARCSDGLCGEVVRLVVDPAARTVAYLVIEPKHRREPGRLVPIDLVDTAAGDVRLRCTLAQFGQLDLAEETDLVEGAGEYGAAESVGGYGAAGGMGVGGSATGLGIGMGTVHRTPTVVHDVVPLGDTEVSRGEHVHALDGEIGQVQGFLVDPADHQVTHVLLQEGHMWGRKEVAIPISAVTAVADGIRLNLTRKQVGDLPPAG